MSLRLVDKDNVETLPVANPTNIMASIQGFADAIFDETLKPTTAILITVEDGMVDFAAFGEQPDVARALGIIELAKAKIISGSWR